MQHIAEELGRIEQRMAAAPDPFEHAGLYTAQQALRWAVQPEFYASPFAMITGSAAGGGDCCSGIGLLLSEETNDASSDVAVSPL